MYYSKHKYVNDADAKDDFQGNHYHIFENVEEILYALT